MLQFLYKTAKNIDDKMAVCYSGTVKRSRNGRKI